MITRRRPGRKGTPRDPNREKPHPHLLATRFHLIEGHDILSGLSASSRALTHGPFLLWLRDEGRAAAQQWMTSHRACLGKCGTVDIRSLFFEG